MYRIFAIGWYGYPQMFTIAHLISTSLHKEKLFKWTQIPIQLIPNARLVFPSLHLVKLTSVTFTFAVFHSLCSLRSSLLPPLPPLLWLVTPTLPPFQVTPPLSLPTLLSLSSLPTAQNPQLLPSPLVLKKTFAVNTLLPLLNQLLLPLLLVKSQPPTPPPSLQPPLKPCAQLVLRRPPLLQPLLSLLLL